MNSWHNYYAAAGDAPRDTLLLALERFDREGRLGLAVDLGCGTGRDTFELLHRGWEVIAIDSEEEAITRLEARLRAIDGAADRVSTRVSTFRDASWPKVDLINASFALPFSSRLDFETTWARIRKALLPGGRFSGHLFGDQDEWAISPDKRSWKGEITFHTREQVKELLEGLEVERLDEVEEDGTTAVGKPKHWHLFDIVARTPI
jgi:SAM-dependent methyltransferase